MMSGGVNVVDITLNESEESQGFINVSRIFFSL